ncbi:MAG: hypothetical protein ABI656_01585 [bacterium]
MSLLSHDELHIALSPEQVLLILIGRRLTRQGLVRRVLIKKVVFCDVVNGGDSSWAAALKVLADELPALTSRRVRATVVISNHFMRYAVVPWSEALHNESEELAFARYCFRQLYGAAADIWELCLNRGRIGVQQLASAVDDGFLKALRALFMHAGMPLTSVQPHLMAAYNSCRAHLGERSAWFVLFEPGCLCLALIQNERWINVRTMRVGSDWRESLPLLLEREAYLVESDMATDVVFLWAPELGNETLPAVGRWKIHNLQLLTRSRYIPGYERCFATAVSK